MHTAYDAIYEGGLGRPGTFIEFSKSLIDELHRFWIKEQPMTPFTLTTRSIHFYDSMVAFERGLWAPPENVWAGQDNGELAELFGPDHPPIPVS